MRSSRVATALRAASSVIGRVESGPWSLRTTRESSSSLALLANLSIFENDALAFNFNATVLHEARWSEAHVTSNLALAKEARALASPQANHAWPMSRGNARPTNGTSVNA